jgi:hypothetical protein
MSQQKLKRYEMWIEGKSPLTPEISRHLPKLILEVALIEDVTGPLCSGVVREEYVAKLAPRLRESVARELQKAGIAVSDEELARICRISASETFVIRRLNEARLEGEILVKDFKDLPFYATYRDYFEQSPDIVAKAIGITINAAVFDRSARRDTDKN